MYNKKIALLDHLIYCILQFGLLWFVRQFSQYSRFLCSHLNEITPPAYLCRRGQMGSWQSRSRVKSCEDLTSASLLSPLASSTPSLCLRLSIRHHSLFPFFFFSVPPRSMSSPCFFLRPTSERSRTPLRRVSRG